MKDMPDYDVDLPAEVFVEMLRHTDKRMDLLRQNQVVWPLVTRTDLEFFRMMWHRQFLIEKVAELYGQIKEMKENCCDLI